MFTRFFRQRMSAALIGALLLSFSPFSLVWAQTKPNQEFERVAKLKTKLAQFGTDKKVRVEVRLPDNTKRTGYLSQVNETSFVLTDLKTGQSTEFVYGNVADAKKPGKPAWVKLAIAGGIAIAVLATLRIYCGNPDYGCD